jgi:16S rRNA (adenine1518-N6/adenine1519-N6)-dimethyltransferase
MLFPTKSLIRKLGLKPGKRYGQNFLIDENIASKAVQQAGISAEDTVIEIGPGPGALTFFLLKRGAKTFSLEIDRNLFQLLTDSLPQDSPLTLINQDILKVNFSDFSSENNPAILIGSIPYYITTPIFLKLLEESRLIKRAVFILQKEVAQRLCAGPGTRDYGVLSVYCQAYLRASLHLTIPPQCFFPRPKVDSALIELVPLNQRCWNDEGEALFQQIIRASFSKRRKTLYNCLKSFMIQNNHALDLFIKESGIAGIDLNRRAETLSFDEFYRLTEVVRKLQKSN